MVREKDIDLLRGGAVILVLWGHAIQYMSQGKLDFYENIVFRFIYGFHMALFMTISGYLFWYSNQKYEFLPLMRKTFRNILHPLIVWSTVSFLFRIPKLLFDFREGGENL